MNKKSISKLLLAGLVTCCALSLGTDIASAYSSTSTIDIEIQTTMVDVTVPSSAPFIFNEDGTTTTPDNWCVKNNSNIAGIYLSKIEVDGTEAGWKVLGDSYDTKTMPVNTKSIRLKIGKDGELRTIQPKNLSLEDFKGEYIFNKDDIIIPSGSSQELKFKVDRGAFTLVQASSKAFEMTMEFLFT